MYKAIIGCLLAQATFEILEGWEQVLPVDSVLRQASSEITAGAQLFTFGIIPAITQFHEAQSIMSRERCIDGAKSTKSLISLVGYSNEAKNH